MAHPSEFGSLVRRDEIARLIEPYVKRRLDEHSAEWQAIIKRLHDRFSGPEPQGVQGLSEAPAGRALAAKLYTAAVTLRRRFLRRPWKPSGKAPARPATRKRTVKEVYEQRWAGRDGDARLFSDSTAKVEWGQQRLFVQSPAIKRVYLLYVYRLVARLAPKSVLEIGCGNGVNVALLANRFPDIAFRGVELTAAGVDQGRRLCASALPAGLADFSPEPLRSETAHRRVRFDQGDAAHLPYAIGEFDLVITILALEQMEKIRDAALRELARVCREHAVMIEPFRERNLDGLRQAYIRSRGYFSGSISELERYGLAPVFVATDFPAKAAEGVAVVLARKDAGG